jgi:hypothetical protein
MLAALVIALCAVINRLAGGGWPVNVVQGSPWRFAFGRYQSAAYIGLTALLMHDWQIALAFGLGFWFWRLFGWGHLISLGRESGATARPATGVDWLLVSAFGAHLGLVARMTFVLPGLIAVSMLNGFQFPFSSALVFGVLAMIAYEVAWRLNPRHVIRDAEITVGALWGALIAIA